MQFCIIGKDYSMGSMITGVKECILLFNEEMNKDVNHRYRSWEHCYSFFRTLDSSINEEKLDLASLHLAFYLASWGMYRGSSKLLQKDYKVHKRIIRELLDDKYKRLWHLDFGGIDPGGREVYQVFQIVDTLRNILTDLEISPTNTLVTKVLLGTIGCIPAYDELFINGVTYWNHQKLQEVKTKLPAHFGKNSYNGLINFYRQNKDEILKAQRVIGKKSIEYPVMKLVDMYFWNLGYQLGR